MTFAKEVTLNPKPYIIPPYMVVAISFPFSQYIPGSRMLKCIMFEYISNIGTMENKMEITI